MDTASIYLVATLLAGMAALLIRLPPLVGFLLAGFALNAAGVEELPGLQTVADLGVTLLLFGIGLKLDVRSLLRREVWLTAGAHMAVSIALAAGLLGTVALVAGGLLPDRTPGAVLLVGFALSFSSTVFVVKTLDERSDATALYGRIAIGVLIMQDLAAVVFIALSRGEPPSIWAATLPLLVPGVWLFRKVWDRLGHGEMQALFGFVIALVPGYYFFEAVGLKGDLGALVMGAALASHPRSGELAGTLFTLKELLLVAFFVNIGLTGLPTAETFLLAALLMLLVPVKGAGYTALLSWLRLRHRTAALAGVSLANYSEFGLIVVAVGAGSGMLSDEWLVTVSVAVALSFVLSATINRRGIRIATWLAARLPGQDPERLNPDDRPIDVSDAEGIVLGMGRIGKAAFLRLRDEHGLTVLGVEHDGNRADALEAEGLRVVRADASDLEFWQRVCRTGGTRIAVLAMPFHGANLVALEQLRAGGFTGTVAAVARYDDELEELEEHGAGAVFHLYGSAGLALADAVVDEAGPDR